MITEDGQVFTEDNYEGYGEFGGKDFYVLAAELNGLKGETDDKTRNMFFDKIWKRGVEKDGKKLYYRDDFEHYEAPITVEGIEGTTKANELVSKYGWKSFNVSETGDAPDFVNAGFKMPKIVEHLPASNTDWKKFWDSVPYPVSCPDQGFFYDDEDFDEDEMYGDDDGELFSDDDSNNI